MPGKSDRDHGDTAQDTSDATMPSQVSGKVSVFDRFASAAATFVSRPWFFAFCLLLIFIWAPSFFLFGNVDT
jgi:hypothetical protein